MSTVTFGRRGVPPGGQPGFGPPRAPPPPETPPRTRPAPPSIVSEALSFQGRARRLHYWTGQGVFVVLYSLIMIASHALKGRVQDDPGMALVGFLALLGVLATSIYASLTLVVRRWHDRGKSGFWALLGFIPIVGWLWQGIECGFLDGTLGPNRYGPSPKGIEGVLYDRLRSPGRA